MATTQQLETALRNADAAGDVMAARALATALQASRGTRNDFAGPSEAAGSMGTPDAQAALAAKASATRQTMGMAAPKADALGPTADHPARELPPESQKGSLFVEPLAQGLTFGWSDEIAGVVGGLGAVMQGKPFSEGYDATRNDALSSLAAVQTRQPVLSAIGEGIGMLGGAVATRGLGALAGAPISVGASLAGNIGRGIVGGAAGGAAYGAGTGDSAEDRVTRAVQQGAIGAGLGGVAPVVARGIGMAGGAIVNGVQGMAGESTPAGIKAVSGALERDAVAPSAVNAMGPDAMIADLGPNVQQQAAAVAAMPGEGQQVVKTALKARAAGAGDRVRGDVDSALGPQTNVVATADQIAQQRAAQAAPLYQQAYATPIQVTPQIQAALSTPSGKAALARAVRLAADEGMPIDPKNLDTRALDYVKRALDDMGNAALKSGAKEQFRALGGIRGSILGELDNQNPTYAQARAAYAGPSAMLDALDAGQKVFTRILSPDELRASVAALSPGEKVAFTQGARQAVEEIMATARNDAGAALRELAEKGWNAEKLRVIAGGPAADQLITALKREKVFADSGYKITANSETAARLAGIADISGGKAAHLAGQAKNAYTYGGTLGPVRALAAGAVDKVISVFVRGSAEQRAAAIGRILVATGPERDAMVRRLNQYRRLYASNQDTVKAIETASRALLVSGGRVATSKALDASQPSALAN